MVETLREVHALEYILILLLNAPDGITGTCNTEFIYCIAVY